MPPERTAVSSDNCVFCSIVAGTTAAAMVAREAEVSAFLDARPLFKGHVLVVPNRHLPTLDELPVALATPLISAVQRVTRALERGLAADGCFVALNHRVSQSVAHVHFHVVPRRRGDGLRGFFWPRQRYESDAERDDYARRIAAALEPP